MLKTPYLLRLFAASAVASVVTLALTVLVMWMNGMIVEDKPSVVSYTPCVFGEKKSAPPENPFAQDPLLVDCVSPEDVKPLFTQWFDSILSRRYTEDAPAGALGR
jgi:hypothetical protein